MADEERRHSKDGHDELRMERVRLMERRTNEEIP